MFKTGLGWQIDLALDPRKTVESRKYLARESLALDCHWVNSMQMNQLTRPSILLR
jgi:hypothetical protein